MTKSLGNVAYEAAAKVTGCEQPWEKANREKWEAAAAAVNAVCVARAIQVVGWNLNDYNRTIIERIQNDIRLLT